MQWNQTNYYTLNSDRLIEYLKQQNARSTETVEMWSTPSQNEKNQTLEVRDSQVSYIETKNTIKEITAKRSAAALSKLASEEENNQKSKLSCEAKLSASYGANKAQPEANNPSTGKDKSSAQIDYKINKKWQESVSLLDGAGIPINKTVTDLLKLYPPQKVENAIALLRARKREKHIPNLSGYFVAALKGDWGSKTLIESESKGDRTEELDTAAVFRHWYDLARELGYCSGQEIREGSQWICLSGAWEKWADAVKRGYSLDYLKKIIKRNRS